MKLSLTSQMDKEVSLIEPDYAQAAVNLINLPELPIKTKDDIEQQCKGLKKRKNNPHKSAVISLVHEIPSSSWKTLDPQYTPQSFGHHDESRILKNKLKNLQIITNKNLSEQDCTQNRILPKESQLSTTLRGSQQEQQFEMFENNDLQIQSTLRSKSKGSLKFMSNVKGVSPANSKDSDRDSFAENCQQPFDLASRSSNQMRHFKGILKQSRSSSMNNSQVSLGSSAGSEKRVRFSCEKKESNNTLFRDLLYVNKSKIE